MLKSMIIAFSTYSKIPMPRVKWEAKNMGYSMCFFPMVGVCIGLCSLGCFYGLEALGIGKITSACILTVLPVWLSGGIHMDGFLDTIDAKSSYKSKEDKLKILQDPHTGAFAIIYGILYMFLAFALFCEVTDREIGCIAAGYVYSRALSGWSVVTLRKAKEDGMAAVSANTAEKNVKWILAAELIVCAAVMVYINPLTGLAGLAAGAVTFIYYRQMAYRIFGGITGDLAGYFLQVCEWMVLLAAVLTGKG